MIRHTLAAGADAYVRKDGDFELLLDAIRDKRAHRGVMVPGGESRDNPEVT